MSTNLFTHRDGGGPMSQITLLAGGQLTAIGTITIELVEADETPAVVIVRWPSKPTVFHPRRFPSPLTMRPGHLRPLRYGWQRSGGSGSCDRAPAGEI